MKNKEIINCCDCKHLHILNTSNIYAICLKENIIFKPFDKDTRTFFCASGEKPDVSWEDVFNMIPKADYTCVFSDFDWENIQFKYPKDYNFISEIKNSYVIDPLEILNFYRNLYHCENDTTERGIMSRAINDLFVEYKNVFNNKEKQV